LAKAKELERVGRFMAVLRGGSWNNNNDNNLRVANRNNNNPTNYNNNIGFRCVQ
jgi:formylglycine-generating enzyme required for sulfatase activity